MPSKSFACNPAQFASLRQQLAASGITVPEGNSGQITGDGITANFTFDGGTLTVTGVSKSGWLPTWSMVFEQIQQHISSVT